MFEYLEYLSPGDLLLLDRGYPARRLIAHLTQHGIPFCVRADNSGFNAVKSFLRSDLSETVVTLPEPDQTDCEDCESAPTSTQVRLVRVVTPNGRVHAVITSLLDTIAYPAGRFADLYHSRWLIEKYFKRLKHRMPLENTSGLSWLAAQQNFRAKILADNLHALAVLVATGLDDIPESHKLNRTYASSHLKRYLPQWLLIAIPSTSQMLAAFSELTKNLIRFTPGATKPRPYPSKPHRKYSHKSTT